MKKISSAAKIGLVLTFGLTSGAIAQDFCNASHSGTKKTVSFSVGAGADKGETGPIGDYHYEQWNKSGSATTDFYTDGSFSCSFSNTDDFLCREGLYYGMNSGKDPLAVGNLVADYSMKTFTNDKSISYAYAGIYGWMQDPLIEWYIVDNWGPASRPNWLGTSQGKITVDGAEYEIFTADANRASIEGNKPFKQIYSLRSTARKCGTISITEHFKAWKQKGITLGSSLYEAKVLGEAGQYPEQQGASGKIDFNYAKVYVSDGPTKPTSSSAAAPKSSSSQGGGSTVSGTIDACKDQMGHEGNGKTDRGRDNSSVTGNVGSSPYHYEIWYQGGNNSMTYYDNGTYKASWSNTGDFLARVGFKYDEKQTYEQVGPIDAYFNWKKQGSAGGYNYIGIYGWTVDPLVEYYIVDDWFSKPGANLLGQRKGEFTVDGDTYEIWQNTRVNKPSIKGDQTFPQFFSVRKSARSCGHIDITAHFKKWESLGMKMGKMYEAKVLVEAGGGSGSFDVTYFKMTDKKHPLPQPESSSSSEAKSSSSKTVKSSSSTIGIHAIASRVQFKSGNFQVFDMQGRFLGDMKVEAGATVNEVLKANFKNAGVYMVKQGEFMQRFSVK